MIRFISKRRGFNLVELLIGLAIASILLSCALQLLLSATRSLERNELRVDAGEAALLAHAGLQADLARLRTTARRAPFDLAPARLSFQATGPGERVDAIAWSFEAPRARLTRSVNGRIERAFDLGAGAGVEFRYAVPSFERGQGVRLGEAGNRLEYAIRIQRTRLRFAQGFELIGVVPLTVKISGNLFAFWGGEPAGMPATSPGPAGNQALARE